ncbi:LamG-like jellyroll fold domain-containing protein [Nonomuraea sp. NPDC000554]|uniref:LamG-like jellyroll fold domain-containing protein n=1 Tax=Nonomuraea sp. NPDC000554 TaxID=3154259 RepID=UPI00331C2BBA
MALSVTALLLPTDQAAAEPSPTASASAKETKPLPPVDSAKAEAKRAGRQVEIPSLHTEGSTTYANSDGKTLSTEFYTDPIRFKRGDAWQAVDTTLVNDNGTIKPRATKAGLTLSPGGGTDLLTAKSGRDGSAIKVSAPQELPAPKLAANRAEYANAYGPGIDLAVIATPTGFRQEVVIRQRPVNPLKLPVPIQLSAGLSFDETSSGTLSLHDSTAKARHRTTEIPASLLIDASADLSVGEEGKVGKVTAAVEETTAGQALIYKPDAGFLTDPNVTYPVTLVVAASDWTELPVGNDTFINNSAYQNGYANSGAYHLQAGKTNEGTVRWRTYIRFEEIPTDSPLRGGRVTNADLILWNIASNDCGESVGSGITARRITQRWDVSTLTWSNQPTVTSEGANTEYGAYNPGCGRGYMDYEWDLYHSVNTITQAWADGQPNYGFQLTAGNESDYTNWRAYRSKEYVSSGSAHGPKLVIGYEPSTVEEIEIAYERDGLPDDELPTYEELLANQIPQTATEPQVTPITVEEAAERQQKSDQTFEVDPDTLPDEPPLTDPPTQPDTTPPTIVATVPDSNAIGVQPTTSVMAFFTEAVTDAQMVVKNADGTTIPGTTSLSPSGEILDFAPEQPLGRETTFTAQVSGAKDAAGNTMEPYSWTFTTAQSDGTAPTVTGTVPTANAADVPHDAPITVTFSENVSEVRLTVKDASDAAVQGSLVGGNGNVEWTFTPASPLAAQSAYRVEVSGAKDASGNVMAPYTWSFTTAADTPNPVPGLVAAYGMNEGSGARVADSSGQNNTGTGSGTGWADGKYGKAASFNGTSSWITVADAASLRLTTGMTLSAWVNPATVANWSTVVTKELSAGGVSYNLYAANGVSVPSGWVQTSPGGHSTVSGLSPLPVNSWSHVALTYDGTALRLFVNGEQVAQTSLSGNLYDDGSPLRIGGNAIWGEYFSGLIDEVRVYKLAQTAAQIQSDMNTPVGSSTPGPNPDPTPTPTPTPTPNPVPGLVAAYGMEEGTGTSVGDSSGQNNTGAARDTSWATGKHGKALSFNGSSSWITVQHAASLRLTNALTLSAWVNPTTVSSWRSVVMKDHAEGGAYGLYASNGTGPASWLKTDDGVHGVALGGPLPLNQWSHLAATYDGSVARLYVNGTQVAESSPFSGELVDDGGALRIGGNTAWGEYFSGLIDEVRVYNRAQTAAEIQADMNAPIGAAPAPSGAARTSAAADPTLTIEKLTVNGSRNVNGVTVASTLTPHLTTWLSNGRGAEATVEVQVAHKPTKSKKTAEGKWLIWSSRATVKPGDSMVTLQVAKDRLRAGEEVRWRVRATTAGVNGPWTTWQALDVKVSDSAAQPKVSRTEVAAATPGPLPTLPTNRLDFQKCWDNKKSNSKSTYPHGWVRDSYNWCSVRTVGKASTDKVREWCGCPTTGGWRTTYKVKGKLEFLFSVAGHTFAGGERGKPYAEIDQNNGNINSRTIKMWARVDDIKITGPSGPISFPETTDLTVNIASGAPSGMHCAPSSGGARTSTIAQWRDPANRQQYFEFVSNKNASAGPHRLSVCTFAPTLALGWQANVRTPFINTKMIDMPVRCDTSEELASYYGGCVYSAFVPTFQAPLIYGWKDGSPIMNESTDLIRRALEEPAKTDPKKTDEPKVIPGARNVGPLHRSSSQARDTSNRAQSVKYCAQLLTGGEPSPKGKDCDEYPFAATHEGSAGATTNRNVAVDFIAHDHNRSVGSKLRWFWQSYRVFGSDAADGGDRLHPFESFYVKTPN